MPTRDTEIFIQFRDVPYSIFASRGATTRPNKLIIGLQPEESIELRLMRGLDLGLERFKFFPAEASGGIAALKALSGPFANIRFCPTGGIRPDNAADWLALETVLCVGGTWLYRKGDSFDDVGERARAAAALQT